MGIGGRSGIKTEGLYERILSLKREGESNVAFMERCKIGGTTNMSKWKHSPISGQSLLAVARANKCSLDWLVFGKESSADNAAQMVDAMSIRIEDVLAWARTISSGSVQVMQLAEPGVSSPPTEVQA